MRSRAHPASASWQPDRCCRATRPDASSARAPSSRSGGPLRASRPSPRRPRLRQRRLRGLEPGRLEADLARFAQRRTGAGLGRRQHAGHPRLRRSQRTGPTRRRRSTRASPTSRRRCAPTVERDAKYNLELLLRKLVARGTRPAPTAPPADRATDATAPAAASPAGGTDVASLVFLTPWAALVALAVARPARRARRSRVRRERQRAQRARPDRAAGQPDGSDGARRRLRPRRCSAWPPPSRRSARRPGCDVRTDAEAFYVLDTSRSMLAAATPLRRRGSRVPGRRR